METKYYACIDLKSFFASVECVERGLDSMKAHLVVADDKRGGGAICLAVSPALKAHGVKNRCRLFEIPSNLSYIIALPRMKKYMEYSAKIYSIYLKYVSGEDIHVYSIDECFLDITQYCRLYSKTPKEMAKMLTDAVYRETGICATVGIGTNLFLAKVALDITAAIVERAIEGKYDLIVSHHPLIFSPLSSVTASDPVAKKVIRLLLADVAAMSFHTRLDAVEGGVNDTLAQALGLTEIAPFGMNGEAIGRVGYLSKEMSLADFAQHVKKVTNADQVLFSDAGLPVRRVAVLGGAGASEIDAAKTAGADTYLTGELKHNNLTDAPERGMNLVAGGHFHTENPVCARIAEMLGKVDASLTVDVINSNPVCVL